MSPVVPLSRQLRNHRSLHFDDSAEQTNSAKNTRNHLYGGAQYSYRGADVGSDHYLVKATIKLRLKRRQGQRALKPFAVEKLKNDNCRVKYQLELSNRFQQLQDATVVEEQWALFRKAVSESADQVVGRRRGSLKER